MINDLSAEQRGVFGKLSKSMGSNYVSELMDAKGWKRVPGVDRPSGAEREGEVVLTKPVTGTENELRLFRWDRASGRSDPFRYSIEVGPVGAPTVLLFGVGMTGAGEPQLCGPFERALASVG